MASLFDDLTFRAGGGETQAQFALGGLDLAQRMESTRKQTGFQLLDHLTRLQQDPFSIVPALQAFSAAGGGTLAPAVDLAEQGARPSPFGDVANRLIQSLSEFAGGSPINPKTGMPFTPKEMAFLRIVGQGQGGQQTQQAQQAAPKAPVPVGDEGQQLNPITGQPFTTKEIAFLEAVAGSSPERKAGPTGGGQVLTDTVRQALGSRNTRKTAGRSLRDSTLGVQR